MSNFARALKNKFALKIFTVFNTHFTFRLFEQLSLAPRNSVCPEIFHCIEYMLFIIQDFWATCACPEKQSCTEKFQCIEIFFIIQDFWETCACPEKQSLPEIFHWIEYIFYHSGFLSNSALALKDSCPENLHCIKYTFYIQDFWASCACPEKSQAGKRQSHPPCTPMIMGCYNLGRGAKKVKNHCLRHYTGVVDQLLLTPHYELHQGHVSLSSPLSRLHRVWTAYNTYLAWKNVISSHAKMHIIGWMYVYGMSWLLCKQESSSLKTLRFSSEQHSINRQSTVTFSAKSAAHFEKYLKTLQRLSFTIAMAKIKDKHNGKNQVLVSERQWQRSYIWSFQTILISTTWVSFPALQTTLLRQIAERPCFNYKVMIVFGIKAGTQQE